MDIIILIVILIVLFIFYSIKNNSSAKSFGGMLENYNTFCIKKGYIKVGVLSHGVVYRSPVDGNLLNKVFFEKYDEEIPFKKNGQQLFHYFGILSPDNSYGYNNGRQKDHTLYPPNEYLSYLMVDGYKINFSKKNISNLYGWEDDHEYYSSLLNLIYEDLAIKIKSSLDYPETIFWIDDVFYLNPSTKHYYEIINNSNSLPNKVKFYLYFNANYIDVALIQTEKLLQP